LEIVKELVVVLVSCEYHMVQVIAFIFGRKSNMAVILLYGGHKKTQSKDIALAQEYWADYLRRTE